MSGPTLRLKVRFRTTRRADAPEPTGPKAPAPIARRIALAHHIDGMI